MWRRIWLPTLLCLIVGTYWIAADHPPYPRIFKMQWEEEVRVAENQVILVHRTATYWRPSAWTHGGTRKIAEGLTFVPTPRIGEVHLDVDSGGFGGVERMGEDWVVSFGGSDLKALRFGSCSWNGRGNCFLIVKADGTLYRPRNANEVVYGFQSWFRCRTSNEDCYRRFNGRRLDLATKQLYVDENPQPVDEAVANGKPYPPAEMTTP